MSYPVLSVLPEIREKLARHSVVILEAPPGAGKSTVLPLELLHEPWIGDRKIVMLEPRRLAARSVAMRMAQVSGEEPGQTIGYRVRFESRVGRTTRLEVVTEGILTRMIQSDNALEEVGLVIFDEYHERSLQADLSLALCLQIQQVLREDLRLLIMSATLDGDRLGDMLGAPVVRSEGRKYPVTFHYVSDAEKIPVATAMARVIRKAFHEHPGDILAFFPGAGEIRRTAELLDSEGLPAVVHPLYGDLNFRKQQQAIVPDPEGRRKIVLATSIAETSLTIEGVSVVVDCGFARVPRFDPRSGFTRLETIRITKDAADQRAGRAGRLGPGVCYRLWSQGLQGNLVPCRNPEIVEADLAPMMLELAQWGVQAVGDLTWITPPPAGAVNQALELLQNLGAVEGTTITARGKEMLRLPTHPRIAHMLLDAKNAPGHTSALPLAIDVAAILEERDPLPKGSSADLTLRIEVLRRWRQGARVAAEQTFLDRIERIALAWRQMFGIPADNEPVSDAHAGKWILAAYPERIARQMEKHGERYKMANGRTARLPQHDPLHREPWLAIAQVDAGMQEGKIFLAAPVDEEDLLPLAAEHDIVTWDNTREMVVGTHELRIGNLILSAKPQQKLDEAKKNKVLCSVLREQGLAFLHWDEIHQSWQARVMSLRQWRPDEPWPDVSDEILLRSAEEWLTPFLTALYKRSDVVKLDLLSILNTLLPWELQSALERLAPARLPVPSGSLIRLQYFPDGRPPVMEVRLQEVFGLLETPSVNEGRNKVVMHLLSPGYKPVQVTQDLKSFWTNTYAEVRKELKSRYPRHSWPEDPWTAEAVRGVRKRT